MVKRVDQLINHSFKIVQIYTPAKGSLRSRREHNILIEKDKKIIVGWEKTLAEHGMIGNQTLYFV